MLRSMPVLKHCRYFILSIKMFVMSGKNFSFGIGITKLPLSNFPGRRRRKWVSWVSIGCYYDQICYVVHHCPVVNGITQVHQSWVHRVVPVLYLISWPVTIGQLNLFMQLKSMHNIQLLLSNSRS